VVFPNGAPANLVGTSCDGLTPFVIASGVTDTGHVVKDGSDGGVVRVIGGFKDSKSPRVVGLPFVE
jgi:hypothetical protein